MSISLSTKGINPYGVCPSHLIPGTFFIYDGYDGLLELIGWCVDGYNLIAVDHKMKTERGTIDGLLDMCEWIGVTEIVKK